MQTRRQLAWTGIAAVVLSAALARAQTTRPAGPTLHEEPPNTAEPAETGGAPAQQPATPPATQPGAGGPPRGTSRPPSFFGPKMLLIMLAILGITFWWSSRSRRKQQSQRQTMLAGLRKGDKITTIGGIIGTVIEVRKNEVIVKVDETNNIRMRFLRRAIHNIGEEGKDDEPEQK